MLLECLLVSTISKVLKGTFESSSDEEVEEREDESEEIGCSESRGILCDAVEQSESANNNNNNNNTQKIKT